MAAELNSRYVKSVPGIVRIATMVLVLLSAVLVFAQTAYNLISGTTFLAATGILEFLLTLILFFMHLFSIPENYYNIPWAVIEFIYDVIAELLLFVASLLVAIKVNEIPSGALISLNPIHAAYIIGFIALVPLGYDIYLQFKEIRK